MQQISPSITGVMVEFESSQYGVSEENGSVEVSLVKQGSSDIAVSVWLSTLDAGSASGIIVV